LAVLVLIGAGVALTTGGSSARVTGAVRAAAPSAGHSREVDLDPAAIAKERANVRPAGSQTASGGHRPQVVVAVPPGMANEEPAATTSHASTHAPTDAEIQRDLEEFRKYLATIPPTTGKRAAVISSGEAAAPFNAPQVVIDAVQAANQIAKTPYRWGGGHGAWRDKGYDCSGSVSFALAAAGLLNQPLDSTRFMSYGAAGPGKWITIYANASHAFMTIAGLRFDTGGLSSGTRWQASMRPTNGFVARHPPGL
jgi:cell wall-associated NlpC family hydrolase